MERPPFERMEMLEKDANKRSNILCRIFRSALFEIESILNLVTIRKTQTYDALPKLGVRKPNADRLIDKEDIRILIPRLWVTLELHLLFTSAFLVGFLYDPTRSELHEETHGGGTTWAAIRPKYDVVLCWVAPALEKVEKEVTSLDVDVPRV